MPKDTVEIPVSVLASVETLDELEDWLTAQNPQIVAELRKARRRRSGWRIQRVEAPPRPMAYRVEVGRKARAQLDELDPIVGSAIERKIIWLAENAAVMIHRRLVGMPEDLAGLCKLRVGDWRILYWIYHAEKVVVSIEFSTDQKCIGISRITTNAHVEVAYRCGRAQTGRYGPNT